MTHATTARPPEGGMEGTMTANGGQGASGPAGAKNLRNAPRAGPSLRCSADPFHRGSERSRGAGSGPRTGTPPFEREFGHAQPRRSRGEAAPARSRGRRRFGPARAGRDTGSATRTLFGCVVAAFLLLAGLVTAVPAQAQSPQLLSATASFSTVTLTYDRTLNSSSVPTASHFTTSVGTVPERFKCGSGDTAGTNCFSQPANPTITNVEVSGSAVVLTLSAPHPLRYLPRIGEWIPGMYVKYTRRTTTIQSQGGVGTDNSCGQAHIGIPRVSHWRLLGCWHVKGGKNYTGTGVPVTLTSGSLGQLVPRHITDIQISDHGGRNGETVDITVTFGGTAKFANPNKAKPTVWTPGWCQNTGSSRPHSAHAKYESGANSASLLFRCTIFNGPHTSLRIAPNSVHDGSNNLRISGTVTEYSYDYNVHADLRHGAVVKKADTTPPTLVDSFTDPTGAEIHFQMSEDLDLSNLPPASAFTATVDGSDVTVTAVARGGAGFLNDTVKITVSPVVRQGQAVVAAYADPTAGDDANAIQDVFGNDAASFTTGSGGVPAVNNQSSVSMQREAPTITGAPALGDPGSDGWTPGEAVEVTLTFSEAVTVDTTDGTPSIGLDLGGTESRRATYLRGSGTTALVFGYTLTDADGTHTSMLVPINSLALNGGTIRSQATSANAALSHNGAAKSGSTQIGSRDEGDAFTARFGALPESHNGSDAFTFELHFSAAPEGLSYSTVAGGLLAVTGGTVNKARRLTAGSNLGWEVTMTPSQSGAIAIRLPARACTETNAVCAGGSPLGKAVSATVPGIPFTASFSRVPAEHDGAAAFDIRFHLSAEPASLSYRTVQNGLFSVTGGSIEKASRLAAGKNNGWSVRIDPSGLGDVTVRVRGTTACDTAPGVCTADGRKLAGGLQVVIAGPAALSVADAEVEEGADATLDFTVTLSKARSTATTVSYATSDGTATAGSDYTSTSGMLTFGPQETSKTVPVPVLDDAHDEGSETLTLTLSNPSPSSVKLADATATGTINNNDLMPKAWLARFGRTVAEQVIDTVEGRFAAQPAAGVEVTLAGERIGGGSAAADPQTRDEAAERARLQTMSDWLQGGTDEADKARSGSRSVMPRELLTGSSFALTAAVDGGSGGAVSLWGRAAVSGFDGRDGDLSLDGEVVSAMLGTDWRRDAWTAGLLVSHSSGEGSYRSVGGDGKVESSLTGVYPYGRYEVNPRLSVWGVAGHGAGSLTLTPNDQKPLETDMDLMMAAAGLRGVALEAPAAGGVELAVKSDAMAVRTTSAAVRGSAADGTGNLAAGTAHVTRLRLGLEGTWRGLKVGGGEVTPGIEIGVRHDGGDAETGFGLDLGTGLDWSDPKLGIQAEVRGRGMLTHESKGFRERGMSGSLAWEPEQATGRGPRLTLTQTLGGAASGGASALLGRETLAGLAANDNGDEMAQRRFEARFGYGFSAFGDGFTSTPESGFGLSDTGRDYSLGWRLTRAGGDGGSLEFSFEASRRESANDNADPEHAVGMRLTARF